MTSLLRTLLVTTPLLFACNGATSDDATTATPAGGAPAANADEVDDEALPTASFCGNADAIDPVGTALFAAIAPEPAADYIALRRNAGGIPSPGLTKELVTLAERGSLCAGASDVTACTNAYAKLSPAIRVRNHHCFTRGDSVGCLETTADAIAFLKTVDSVEEAFFVAEYAGYFAQCTYSQVLARGQRLADGSFRIVTQKGNGCGDIFRVVLSVLPDGTVTEIESKKTDLELGCP